MKPYWLLILTCWCSATWAATIDNIRIWPAPDNTRLVFDVSAAVTFEKITLTNPDRLVIDIDASVLSTSVAKLDLLTVLYAVFALASAVIISYAWC